LSSIAIKYTLLDIVVFDYIPFPMLRSSITEVNDTNSQLEMFINWLRFLYHIPKLDFYTLICVSFQIIGITRGTAERRKR